MLPDSGAVRSGNVDVESIPGEKTDDSRITDASPVSTPDMLSDAIDQVVTRALIEDLDGRISGGRISVGGDITSCAVLAENTQIEAALVAREELVLAGLKAARHVFSLLSPAICFRAFLREGCRVKNGTVFAHVSGPARAILAGERTAINLLQHLSGIATLTADYVAAIAGTGVTLRDTRKTLPGLRCLEKDAVCQGGGTNHRMGLYDAVLIKDNHIAAVGGITNAVAQARRAGHSDIQIECDTLEDVEQALAAGVRRLLLDNMSPDLLRRAVRLSGGRAELEASGGVTLSSINAIATTGIDAISVGRLTQSAPAVDIGLDVGMDLDQVAADSPTVSIS